MMEMEDTGVSIDEMVYSTVGNVCTATVISLHLLFNTATTQEILLLEIEKQEGTPSSWPSSLLWPSLWPLLWNTWLGEEMGPWPP